MRVYWESNLQVVNQAVKYLGQKHTFCDVVNSGRQSMSLYTFEFYVVLRLLSALGVVDDMLSRFSDGARLETNRSRHDCGIIY